MTKVFAVVFAILTAGAGYLTMTDYAVLDPTIEQPSVRQGSVNSRSTGLVGSGIRGGYRGGK